MLEAYLLSLTGRIFKVLPMREQQEQGDDVYLDLYLDSLSLEIHGACDTFPCLRVCSDYIMVLNTVNGLCADTPLPFLKREVFKMLSAIDRIRDEYGGDK
jgi:hypothetical protein|nr:MAG TPA: hypothetical protein [Caudoviricetes sp.]DAH59260.1 MAG TPA: hypothetical protein [Caudoviricetes sp.]